MEGDEDGDPSVNRLLHLARIRATRVSPAIAADFSLTGRRVTEILDQAIARHGLPKAICADNGPEFAGKELDAWAYCRGVKLRFSRPGKPTDNAFVESFNGRLREECLDAHWFTSLGEARTGRGTSTSSSIRQCPTIRMSGAFADGESSGRRRELRDDSISVLPPDEAGGAASHARARGYRPGRALRSGSTFLGPETHSGW
jgi:hypothetical protein